MGLDIFFRIGGPYSEQVYINGIFRNSLFSVLHAWVGMHNQNQFIRGHFVRGHFFMGGFCSRGFIVMGLICRGLNVGDICPRGLIVGGLLSG